MSSMDMESQTPTNAVASITPSIVNSASASASTILIVWMLNNIGVTLLNKAAFSNVDFKYPYMLTVVHMVINTVGAKLYLAYEKRRDDAT